MSNEDNSKPEEKLEETKSSIESSVEHAKEELKEAAEEIEEAAEKVGKDAKNMVSDLLSSVSSIKQEKPKVFYGGVAGIVVLLLIMMMSGGSDGTTASGPAIKNLVVGQRYVLKSPNVADTTSTIRLVAVPGTLSAYDDTEEDDRIGGCKHLAQGTPVTLVGLQDAYGKKNSFANVKIEQAGECNGTTAWTLSINVQ